MERDALHLALGFRQVDGCVQTSRGQCNSPKSVTLERYCADHAVPAMQVCFDATVNRLSGAVRDGSGIKP